MRHSTIKNKKGSLSCIKKWYQPEDNKKGGNYVIVRLGILAGWLGIWQLAAMGIGKEILFVSPLGVWKALGVLLVQHTFWMNILYTLIRILYGFLAGLLGGCVLGMLCGFIPFLSLVFYPLLTIIRTTPVASFIILMLVWMKTGWIPVFISFLMVLPIVWGNIETGVQKTDIQLLEMGKVYGFGFFKTLRFIYMPHLLPYFAAAVHNSIGLAWKSGIAAEVICHPKFAIGTRLYDTKIYLETQELFAWTTVVILLSILLEKLFFVGLSRLRRKKIDTVRVAE